MKEEQGLTRDEKYDIGYYGADTMTDEDVGRILQITEQAEQFETMMMYFDCAMSQMRTKLEILNKEMALKNKRNPFEYIKYRLKSPSSIYGKLKVKGVPFTVENIENTINDVAGIRVICSFKMISTASGTLLMSRTMWRSCRKRIISLRRRKTATGAFT